MEGRKSPKTSNSRIQNIKINLSPPKASDKSNSKLPVETKLNALKVKVFYKQMQKLRKSPEINKISRDLVKYKLSQKTPKSPYIKKILSGNRFIKSVSAQSTKSFISAVDSPRFAVLSTNQEKPENSRRSPRSTNSDIFTRSIQMLKKREEALKEMRKMRLNEGLEECTFKPDTRKRSCSSFRSLSVKSQKSIDSFSTQERSQVIRYTSLSPTPRKFGFSDGCNLKIVRERSSPMFRYLSIRMPLI